MSRYMLSADSRLTVLVEGVVFVSLLHRTREGQALRFTLRCFSL